MADIPKRTFVTGCCMTATELNELFCNTDYSHCPYCGSVFVVIENFRPLGVT